MACVGGVVMPLREDLSVIGLKAASCPRAVWVANARSELKAVLLSAIVQTVRKTDAGTKQETSDGENVRISPKKSALSSANTYKP